MDGQHDDDMKHDDAKVMNTNGINDNPFRQLQHGDADCDDEVDGQHDDEKDMSNSDGGIHDGSCMFRPCHRPFNVLISFVFRGDPRRLQQEPWKSTLQQG